ncbi:MAG: hypothetical protein IKP92_00595 [Lachnospiraceae bacterium]|nr:hypothetical protein [Lachnospiraceae bacterium]
MPYQFKNDNELNELIAAVKAKNAKGEGLNNEEIQLGLHSIALMLQKTADSIETKLGARELNEFKMELEGTAKSLEALRDPAILEDPGKFEDALADLVNLKDLLLKRTHNGRLYYEIIELKGRELIEGVEGVSRSEFFKTLQSIGEVLETGMPNLEKEVNSMTTREARQAYAERSSVIELQNDKDAQTLAGMMDTGSTLYKNLNDYIFGLQSPAVIHGYDRKYGPVTFGLEYGCYSYSKALKNTIDEANKTHDFAKKRELFMQAVNIYKSFMALSKMKGDNESKFPLNTKKTSRLALESGKRFLINAFDEKNPKVVEQVKARKSPSKLELPTGVSKEMAVCHLGTYDKQKYDAGSKVEGDYYMLLSFYSVLRAEANYEENDKEYRDELSKVVDSLNNFVNKLVEVNDNSKRNGLDDLDSELIKDAVSKFDDVNEKMEGFFNKYRETHPEYIARFKELAGPFLAKFRKMDWEEGLKKITPEILNRPEQAIQPEEYEIAGEEDVNLQSRLYLSENAYQDELNAFRTRVENAVAAADSGNKITQGLTTQNAVVEDICFFRNGKRYQLSSEVGKIRITENTVNSIISGIARVKNKQNAYLVGDDILKARNSAKEYAEDSSYGNDFRKYHLSVYKLLDKHVEASIKASRNPIGCYVVSVTKSGNADSLPLATAAYLYQHEQLRKSPNKTPKYSRSEIEKRAARVKDNVLYKALFVPSEEELKEARDYEAKYDRVLNEEDFRKRYAENKRSYFLNPAKMSEMVGALEHPFSANTSLDAQRKALYQLRELGQTMDRCGFWSSRAYKNFYGGLKALARKDIDSMTSEEMGELLKDLYDKTEAFMNGRMSVRKKPEQREHFEQTLDALHILSSVNRNGKTLADELLRKTNVVREQLHQEKATLGNRNAQNTKKRIDVLRGRLSTEKGIQKGDELFAKLKASGAVSAAENPDPEALAPVPPKTGATITIQSILDKTAASMNENKNEVDFAAVHDNMVVLLALSASAAYKDAEGKACVVKADFEKAIKELKENKIIDAMAEKYSKVSDYKDYMQEKGNELALDLKNTYNQAKNKVKEALDNIDKAALGDAYKMDDMALERKIIQRHKQKKIDNIMKEKPIEVFRSFDDLDKELEEIDLRKNNEADRLLFEEFGIDGDKVYNDIANEIGNKRKDMINEAEIKGNPADDKTIKVEQKNNVLK